MSRFYLLVMLFAVLNVFFSGCREVSSDKTYALWLDHAPTEQDWERALPREITVRGGRPHKLKSFTEIDEDTVHTTTASCHHGSKVPDPFSVDVRAFYTDKEIFLRLSWRDATPDQTMMDWLFDGLRWQNTGAYEDGFGLLWDAGGTFSQFSCSYACHINDFGVNESNFHASNQMRLTEGEHWLDLWNWKAARTAPFGFADDRYLDEKGMHGDTPGDLFVENSRAFAEGGLSDKVFGDNDMPVYDKDRQPVDEGFRAPGTTAPGYLVKLPVKGRADVRASTRYDSGRWIVVLRRALQTTDRRDVVFVPGDELGVAFGLAVMDHSPYEHYASNTIERLVLLKPEGL